MKNFIANIWFKIKLLRFKFQNYKKSHAFKILYVYDPDPYVLSLQIIILLACIFYYCKYFKHTNFTIHFHSEKKYKNWSWMPSWMREILKNEKTFIFIKFVRYCYYTLKYFKCILEYNIILFVSNHYSLAIFIKYILFSISLFVFCYILTKIVSNCYSKFNGEIMLFKILNWLDLKFEKFKAWYYKQKK